MAHKPALHRDRRGIEGLPLQMMVTVAVLALTLPPAFSALEALQKQNSLNRTEDAVGHILLAAKQVALGGDGGVRIIEVNTDIRGLEHISLGGAPGDGLHRRALSYKMKWTGVVVRMTDPPVDMEAVGGGALVIPPGNTVLKITASTTYSEDGHRRIVLLEQLK